MCCCPSTSSLKKSKETITNHESQICETVERHHVALAPFEGEAVPLFNMSRFSGVTTQCSGPQAPLLNVIVNSASLSPRLKVRAIREPLFPAILSRICLGFGVRGRPGVRIKCCGWRVKCWRWRVKCWGWRVKCWGWRVEGLGFRVCLV